MPHTLIRDYLQTQGLKSDADEVRLHMLAAQTVMHSAQAEIDRSVLWYTEADSGLADYLPDTPEHRQALKQVFIALDAACHRHQPPPLTAAVYLLRDQHLLRLAQQGEAGQMRLPADEEYALTHLAVRSARSGWLNWVEDSRSWLEAGELQGSRHERCGSQLSAPVCTAEGRVLGVVYAASARPDLWNAEHQCAWVGLTLALAEPLAVLSDLEGETGEHA